MKNLHIIGKELFITSDEEINQQTKPCWCINTIKNTWNDDLIYYQGSMPQYHYVGFKKIILTTDQDLINDGVQAIDNKFLEWFVKNPSCEEVEVENSSVVKEHIFDGSNDGEVIWEYKIIIPKEEPKTNLEKHLESLPDSQFIRRSAVVTQQETLEEAAEKWNDNQTTLEFGKPHNAPNRIKAFIEGAKWQQERMYSEEEVEFIIKIFNCYWFENNPEHEDNLKDWELSKKLSKKLFEQFKKK